MIQTSCSELLVDTQIHDPKEAYEAIIKLMKICRWESSPPLTVSLLELLKTKRKSTEVERGGGTRAERLEYIENTLRGLPIDCPEIMVYDKEGNRAWLEYGDNGYLSFLGFRLDSHCNHVDSRCYPIFDRAMEILNGQLIACDGGSKDYFYEWKGGKNPDEDGSY